MIKTSTSSNIKCHQACQPTEDVALVKVLTRDKCTSHGLGRGPRLVVRGQMHVVTINFEIN